MIIRLRSKDGLERVKLGENASLEDLASAIESLLGVPRAQQRISADPNLLRGEGAGVALLKDMTGVDHGSMLFLDYEIERTVKSSVPKSNLVQRPFRASMTVAELIAKQTRIERQDEAVCASVSVERHAANSFQAYINQGIAFSVKRCGYMYGTLDEGNNVRVEFIYEPPQDATADEVLVHATTEELDKVETIASLLGLRRVGHIFSQSAEEKDYLISTQEVVEMAQMQETYGEAFVTAVVSLYHSEEGADVHFEAYQCSKQCVKLRSEGWFVEEDPEKHKHTGVSTLRDPREPEKQKPVIVAGKDTSRVDNEWFLCPVKILDHEGLLSSEFPVENRMTPQGTSELKSYLKQMASKPFVSALSNFHLLLYLARHHNMDANDIALIVQAVGSQSDPGEGYKIIIESLAGI